jgi:hypothetical protein
MSNFNEIAFIMVVDLATLLFSYCKNSSNNENENEEKILENLFSFTWKNKKASTFMESYHETHPELANFSIKEFLDLILFKEEITQEEYINKLFYTLLSKTENVESTKHFDSLIFTAKIIEPTWELLFNKFSLNKYGNIFENIYSKYTEVSFMSEENLRDLSFLDLKNVGDGNWVFELAMNYRTSFAADKINFLTSEVTSLSNVELKEEFDHFKEWLSKRSIPLKFLDTLCFSELTPNESNDEDSGKKYINMIYCIIRNLFEYSKFQGMALQNAVNWLKLVFNSSHGHLLYLENVKNLSSTSVLNCINAFYEPLDLFKTDTFKLTTNNLLPIRELGEIISSTKQDSRQQQLDSFIQDLKSKKMVGEKGSKIPGILIIPSFKSHIKSGKRSGSWLPYLCLHRWLWGAQQMRILETVYEILMQDYLNGKKNKSEIEAIQINSETAQTETETDYESASE